MISTRNANTSARIATPSSRKSGRLIAPVILSAALGCRAMLSAAAAANLPMPSAAPITIMPSPIATPNKWIFAIPNSSVVCVSVMNVDGHADEHGRQEREDVCLNQNDDDFETRD